MAVPSSCCRQSVEEIKTNVTEEFYMATEVSQGLQSSELVGKYRRYSLADLLPSANTSASGDCSAISKRVTAGGIGSGDLYTTSLHSQQDLGY